MCMPSFEITLNLTIDSIEIAIDYTEVTLLFIRVWHNILVCARHPIQLHIADIQIIITPVAFGNADKYCTY